MVPGGWLSEIPGTHPGQSIGEPGEPLRDHWVTQQGHFKPDPETLCPSTS